MSITIAKKGHSKSILLIWEYLALIHDALQKTDESQASLYDRPSEGLYENAASTFAASGREDHLVFGILAEMEREGYAPSRSFLIRLASSLRTRSSVRRLGHAMHIIRNSYANSQDEVEERGNGENKGEEEGIALKPTTSGLNIILAGYADFGFSTNAMNVYHEFEQLECIPDENTYSFLMDSIYMDISTAIPPKTRDTGRGNEMKFDDTTPSDYSSIDDEMITWFNTRIEAADTIFEAAIEMGHGADEFLIHSYLKILCIKGDLEKALCLIDEMFENRERISQSTLGILAMSYAERGNFEIVDDILLMSSNQAGGENGLPRHMVERIEILKKNTIM